MNARGADGAERSDAELMSRVAGGDRVAFAALIERYLRRLLTLAQAVLGSSADADEVVQEAFLRIWTRAGTWDPDRSLLTTWLHRIVVNLCIDRLRKPRAEVLDEAAMAVPDPADTAFDQFAREESRARVRSGLAGLPARQRLALALFYYQDLDLRSGAAAMELSPGAFEALLRRARRSLKDQLTTPPDDEMLP